MLRNVNEVIIGTLVNAMLNRKELIDPRVCVVRTGGARQRGNRYRRASLNGVLTSCQVSILGRKVIWIADNVARVSIFRYANLRSIVKRSEQFRCSVPLIKGPGCAQRRKIGDIRRVAAKRIDVLKSIRARSTADGIARGLCVQVA